MFDMAASSAPTSYISSLLLDSLVQDIWNDREENALRTLKQLKEEEDQQYPLLVTSANNNNSQSGIAQYRDEKHDGNSILHLTAMKNMQCASLFLIENFCMDPLAFKNNLGQNVLQVTTNARLRGMLRATSEICAMKRSILGNSKVTAVKIQQPHSSSVDTNSRLPSERLAQLIDQDPTLSIS